MSWTETDDNEIQETYDKLIAAKKELTDQVALIQVILGNTATILTREIRSYDDKNQQVITPILPKDKWGEEMTDENRLIIKDECIAKTNELLGVE